MVVGAALWAVAAKLDGHSVIDPQSLGLALMGSLLPDIDHPQSWAGRKFRVISVPLSAMLGHRGITHSLLAILLGSMTLGAMGLNHISAPLIVGYLSHLLADGLTPSGVPLLWPNRRRFSLPLCKTGSAMEMLVVGLLAALGGWALGVDLTKLPHPHL